MEEELWWHRDIVIYPLDLGCYSFTVGFKMMKSNKLTEKRIDNNYLLISSHGLPSRFCWNMLNAFCTVVQQSTSAHTGSVSQWFQYCRWLSPAFLLENAYLALRLAWLWYIQYYVIKSPPVCYLVTPKTLPLAACGKGEGFELWG